MKVLAVMPTWLGDCVMALPSLTGMKHREPETIIDMAIGSKFAQLAELLPNIRKAHIYDKAGYRQAVSKERYDAALFFPNSFRSTWRLVGLSIPKKIGYKGDFRSWLLTDTIPRPAVKHSEHMSDYYLQIARKAIPRIGNTNPEIAVPEKAVTLANKLLTGVDNRKLIGVGFGASYGSAKMWAPERFAELINRLSDKGTVVLLGGEGDLAISEKVIEKANKRPTSLVGKTDISTLAAVMTRLSLYITNDTGPMHLAALLKTPVVAMFGPTDPRESKPFGNNENVKIIYHQADCAPCFKRTCPKDHRCMSTISTDEVYEASLRHLS